MKSPGQKFTFSILKTFTEIVFVISTLLPLPLSAQLNDDFTDGDFVLNPVWAGTSSSFSAEDGLLQLKAPSESASAFLSTSLEAISNTVWECSVSLRFNPSASNYARIYLISDQPDLSVPLNGYFIMIGGATDEISLYRQAGTTKIKLIDGNDGRVNLDLVDLQLKTTRTPDGKWELWTSVGSQAEWLLEGSFTDATVNTSLKGAFGVFCVFSATRSDKFSFDNFKVISTPIADVFPPQIDSVNVASPNQLKVYFSEPVVMDELSTTGYFSVNENIGKPQSVTLDINRVTATLVFSTTFVKGVQYLLTTQPFADDRGNLSSISMMGFSLDPIAEAAQKDVIITEIFADPSPPVGLPEAEFIEVFNRSENAIAIKNWTLGDAASQVTLPNFVLNPNEFIILTTSAGRTLLEQWGKIIEVKNFPSLNNSGDAIILKDGAGNTIDSVFYSDQWYRDSSKKEGGWSLELIDDENTCAGSGNWTASIADSGGTPGALNSVDAEKPDLTAPELITAYLSAPDTLVLAFNEKLWSEIPDITEFQVSPALAVSSVIFNESLEGFRLILSAPPIPRTEYRVVANTIKDCAGNQIRECCNTAEFAIPEPADSLDVVINEILFNPRTNGVDFVEIVNISEKFIDARELSLVSGTGDEGEGVPLAEKPLILKPFDYVAVTPEPAVLAAEYPKSVSSRFLKAALPPLNNDQGDVALLGPMGKPLDFVVYSATMHSVFLKNKDGVSLERISFNVPAADIENWKSATSTSDFATPGYSNSNMISDGTEDGFSINPEIFLPIYGQPDYTRIEYQLTSPGNMCTVRILNPQGIEIKTITENALLGTEGFFQWEGDRSDGSRARIGPYLVWIEVYDSEGRVTYVRKRVVIAARL
jgi:hypothetical protein